MVANLGAMQNVSKGHSQIVPAYTRYGSLPDRSVKNWIRLKIIGASDHPLPIIWISPVEFERHDPEVLIVLPGDEYEVFSAFVRLNRCSFDYKLIAGRGTVAVTKYAGGVSTVLCVLPPESARVYLSKILALSHIRWTKTKSQSLRSFGAAVRFQQELAK